MEADRNSNLPESVLTPREQMELWLLKLESESEGSFDLGLPAIHLYLFTTHVAINETLSDLNPFSQNTPLKRVLLGLDFYRPEEEPLLQPETELEWASVENAKRWLNKYPDSNHARAIAEQGLEAEFRHHVGLLVEMFSEFVESRK